MSQISIQRQENTSVIIPRAGYPWRRLAIGLSITILLGIIASGIGSVHIHPLIVIKIIVSKMPLITLVPTWHKTFDTILWDIRLPRIVLACITGASLAMSGATYQGLFRNPLADPYLIGVASGAGLGATIVLVIGGPLIFMGVSLVPIAAFVGAITAVTIAYLISQKSDGVPLTTLILAGIAIASMTGALSTILMIRSEPDIRPVLSWLLGGFASAQWKHSVMIMPYLLPSILIVMTYGRVLNVLQLEEKHAQQLGVNVERTKLILIGAASLSTAAAVSFSGLIGFVGLIAPHVVRLIWGVDYRSLLPMAAITGGAFLILADLVARTLLSPTELPVGLVTAFCGGPFFLYLLRRQQQVVI